MSRTKRKKAQFQRSVEPKEKGEEDRIKNTLPVSRMGERQQ